MFQICKKRVLAFSHIGVISVLAPNRTCALQPRPTISYACCATARKPPRLENGEAVVKAQKLIESGHFVSTQGSLKRIRDSPGTGVSDITIHAFIA